VLELTATTELHSLNVNGSASFDGNGEQLHIGKDLTFASGSGFTAPTTTIFDQGQNGSFTNQASAIVFNDVRMAKNGGNTHTLTLSNTDLTLDNNATLKLIEGRIVTNASNKVFVQNSATNAIQNHSKNSYIQGRLTRSITADAYDFPVGDVPISNGGEGYQRARVNFNSTGSSSQATARFFGSPLSGSLSAAGIATTECDYGLSGYNKWLKNGYWRLESDGSNERYAIRLYPQQGSFSSALASKDYTPFSGNAAATVVKRPSGDPVTAFDLKGTCVPASDLATTPPMVARKGLTGFSEFGVVVDDAQPFPVEGLTFRAEPIQDAIQLHWQTQREVNNDGFAVYRSKDVDTGYYRIGWVDGHGSTTEAQSYQLKDTDVQAGPTYFYRLKQVDYNGQANWSNVVSARLDSPENFSVELYPNPTVGKTWLDYQLPSSGPLHIDLYDATGRKVHELRHTAESRTGQIQLDLQEFSAGVYNLMIQTADNKTSIRLVIRH
jgi:hypothetical protein